MRIRIGDLLVKAGVITELQLKAQGRTLLVAMSDPLNISATDHLVSLTGGRKVETRLAGASAIRHAISRWYRGEELLRDDGEQPSMKIVNNAGNTVEGTGRAVVGIGSRSVRASPAAAAKPPPEPPARSRPSAVEVLRGVEDTQRRSVAALKAMVELLIEKGVFSRDEYLARVKR